MQDCSNQVFVVVTSDNDIMPPFIFLHGLKLNIYIVPRGRSAALNRESGCWKTLGLTTRPFAMPNKQENPFLAERKFLRTYQQTSDCNSFDYYGWDVVKWENCKTPCNIKRWTEGNDNGSIYKLKQICFLADFKIVWRW